MKRMYFCRSKVFALAITAFFALLILPAADYAKGQRQGPVGSATANAALVGFIYADDMQTPIQRAVVKLRNIQNQKEYSSDPTDATGMYKIAGLEEGRYIMGIKTPNGGYNFLYALYLKNSQMAKLSVATKPVAPLTRAEPGGNGDGGKSIIKFFKSPAGIMVVVLAGEGLVYGLTAEKEASPIR